MLSPHSARLVPIRVQPDSDSIGDAALLYETHLATLLFFSPFVSHDEKSRPALLGGGRGRVFALLSIPKYMARSTTKRRSSDLFSSLPSPFSFAPVGPPRDVFLGGENALQSRTKPN